MKEYEVKFVELAEQDKVVQANRDHTISEYEKYKCAIKEKIAWKFKYWYSLDLSRFNAEFKNANKKLDEIDAQLINSINEIYNTDKELGLIS